jgi:Fe-S oxidoreductase
MGLIGRWARFASIAPAVANFMTHAPGIAGTVKRSAGIAPERDAPRFARQTFRSWFRRRGSRARPGSPPVLLWPDTFVNFFHPEVGKATVEVLEHAGYEVRLPSRVLCCGRPLYDYGMLDSAKRWLRRVLRTLRHDIRGGVTVIGMEPSCLAVFRDELPNLFPDDEDAKRLSRQSVLLSEFLQQRRWEPPQLSGRKAVVQGHCHHKAVIGFDADQKLLQQLGVDAEVLDSGCCGLAGSFGFEAGEKYEVSMRAGERVLFPKVREAAPDTLIVADGFSCRTQIEHGTRRKALHLAEVIHLALREQVAAP